MRHPPPRSPGLRVLIYPLCLAGVIAALHGGLYWRYLRVTQTRPPHKAAPGPVRHVPERTLLRLGWVTADKDSSFVRHELVKPRGVVRVGCLGDSFTYGQEVGAADDYPSILQKLFRERGYPQVEVINFGSGWYGFQQAFIMWDEVARRFDLDYVLLGPQTFYFSRDTTFDHSSPSTIYFLHARYVLEGDGLRLIEVAGRTFAERTAAYRRLIPHRRYLRYDRRAPAFLACLVPRGRELPNSFYYKRNIMREQDELYRRLLLRMADSGTQVVLGHYRPEVVARAVGLGRRGLYAVRFEEDRGFPYRAPDGHASPAGNRLLAEQFFAVLTGRLRAVLPRVEVRPPSGAAVPSARGATRGEDAFARVSVDPGRGGLWRFVELVNDRLLRDLPDDFLRKSGARALLALRTPGQGLPEAAFYPLTGELREGESLVLRSLDRDIFLGRVSLLRPDLQVGVVELSGALPWLTRPVFQGGDAVLASGRAFERTLTGMVFLGGRALFQLGRPDRNRRAGVRPIHGRFLRIYPPADLLGGGGARRAGELSLRFTDARGASVSVPLAVWSRAAQDMTADFPQPGIPRPIRRPGR